MQHAGRKAHARRQAARPQTKAKQTKVFWFFFSKKNRKKHLFLKKEAKTFVNCTVFADVSWSRRCVAAVFIRGPTRPGRRTCAVTVCCPIDDPVAHDKRSGRAASVRVITERD
jgi:hypothetical protein